MTILQLYTSTKGRISRQMWWLGAAVLTVLYFLAAKLIGLILQYERMPFGPPAKASDGASIRFEAYLVVATESSLWWHNVASFALSVAFSALAWGLCVKRRHDCGANGWDVAVLLGFPLLFLGALRALAHTLLLTAPITLPDQAALVVILVLGCVWALFVPYVLAVLGLLKGQTGTNRYGRDPLAPPATPQET